MNLRSGHGRRVLLPSRRDVVLAAALAAAVLAGSALVAYFQPAGVLGPVTMAAVLVAAGAWAWHRVAPVVSAAVVVAVVAGHVLAGLPYGPIMLLVVVACFAVARHCGSRVAAATCAAAAIVLAAALWTQLDATNPTATAAILVAWPGVFVAVPALAGALVRTRVEAAARERAELLARGADQERLRVAREVHDVAGHGFAVVAMQAGVALTVFDEDPGQARISLEAIRSSSQQALRELQAVLDTLHADAPDARDLPDLVDRVRASGVPVELAVTGDPRAVDQQVSATVYRLVQEALTNVVRHAGPTAAEVVVEYGEHDVTVAVRDRGHGAAEQPGRGLRGLRERVEQLRGTFAAGDRTGGGYQVTATIPATGVDR
ncbi:sensor histidine kinase [Pseudonocardia sp. CA-107938]|uniref:sensor histidine kinase n=1 Tax=Pseudonocardia sp. CA-107938 TaxID=3240021 RepID=UPI003D8B541D